MKEVDTQFSWQQIKRFEFIEWQLLWERRLNAKPLMAYFGISRHQATKDVQSYVELAPQNIQVYDPKLKYYTPSVGFRPIFAKESPDDFVESRTGLSNDSASFIERIHPLGRRVIPGVLPIIMECVDSSCAVDIIYASARSPSGKARRIWPKALAYAADRLHIRAFCAENHEYRDFNVSRILDIPHKVNAPLPSSIDVAWELVLELALKPNENLTPDGQNLIAAEFDLKGGRELIRIRAALLQYFLQDNLLPHTPEQLIEAHRNPWKYPVMVENLETFEKWYF
ncbi:MAG: WYL domain-containing protein [Pseudomonadota bacterium]